MDFGYTEAVMNTMSAQVNLVAGWMGILLGFISGAALGLGFHKENWLGGYGSVRRRLYRLAHISFFGLALLNLMFFFTARALGMNGADVGWASRGFLAGAATMPVCCVLLAHFPRAHGLFAVPVGSLIAAGVMTLRAIYLGGF